MPLRLCGAEQYVTILGCFTRSSLSYSAPQGITAALHNLTGKLCRNSLKHCKVSLQVGAAFEDGVHNKFSPVEHTIMSGTLSPNSSSSTDNRNLSIFPYKLNLFTNKSMQRCRALRNMQRLRAALHCSAE